MKRICNYLNEQLKVNSKSKVHNLKPLEPEEIKGPETPGKDYFDEDVTIIGWPFQKPKDDNHKKTMQYIANEHYQMIIMILKRLICLNGLYMLNMMTMI